MKKNLLSIIILALLIVNIVLTAIMMFSVTGTSKKTAALVDNIAMALDLELEARKDGEAEEVVIPISSIATYDIKDSMTIPLKTDEDGQPHFFIVSVTLSMNLDDKDAVKAYGTDLSAQETLIKSEINSVISTYTVEEARNNQEGMKKEILSRVQKLFDSEFIFNVSFSDFMIQ